MPKTAKQLKPYQFKKGQPSANPKGRPPLAPWQKELRKITLESYREVLQTVLGGRLQDIKELAENPNSSALEVGISKAMFNAVRNGDYATIERVAERIIGKIPDEIKVTATNVNANLNTEIDRAKLKAAMAELEKDV